MGINSDGKVWNVFACIRLSSDPKRVFGVFGIILEKVE
jgi:hypothetical protein